ncbi:hypothetical protein Poli38472_008958 [Pythium oligandrum]|uniref:Ribosome recycling factor domain-containing protein n=1 Tax=Pythium oligandrum TaxID=41045 RepID=A0A8K1FAJ7_PYTOL|nr:hypothetical protein Poli38472_008958 [Pythium oligandrum]|eukprot:TMW56310.1 hypothetical protein Poli38472_008958 [Pythium oligandrum]
MIHSLGVTMSARRWTRLGLNAAKLSLQRTSVLHSAVLNRAVAARCAPLAIEQLQVRAFSKAAKKGKGGGKQDKQAAQSAEPTGDGEEVKALKEKTKKNMHGAVLQFTRALCQMRPGKADAGMFDDLHVQAYGQHVALSQVAQVSVSGTHSVSVNVYDPSLLQDIKKAVEAMNPVFSIREDVNALQISFPKMSKETRAELIKAAKKQAEQSRQHVRRVRQDSMNSTKKLKEHMSEDDVKKFQDDIQKLTDDASTEIGKLLAAKEKDLNEV